MDKSNNATAPANERRLTEWLHDRHARYVWTARVIHLGRLDCYDVGDALAIVMRYDNQPGWELYVPASLDTSIQATLDGADKALKGSVR